MTIGYVNQILDSCDNWSYQTRKSLQKLFPLVSKTLVLDVTNKEASKKKQMVLEMLPFPSRMRRLWMTLVNTWKPQYQHTCSPYCSPYISYCISWENLIIHQDILSLMIIFLILLACMFHCAVVSQGEIRCLSLLGPIGLNWVIYEDLHTLYLSSST